MPQIQQLDTRPIYNEGVSNFGASFADTLEKHDRRKRDEDIFAGIPGYEKEDPIERLDLKKYVIDRAKLFESQDKAAKEARRKASYLEAYPKHGLSPEQAENLSIEDIKQITKDNTKEPKTVKTAEDLGKEQFAKERGKSGAKVVGEAEKKLISIKNNNETLKRLGELEKGIRGVKGYTKILAGSKDAAEFNALGHSLIKVPLEIFNPVGAVPQRKLEMLKDIYAPQAWQRSGVIQGKLKAAEYMNKQAEAYNKNLIQLYSEYGGNPPVDKLQSFEENYEKNFLDPLLKFAQNDFQGEIPVAGFYDENGTPLGPVDPEMAHKLLEEGIIFSEPRR